MISDVTVNPTGARPGNATARRASATIAPLGQSARQLYKTSIFETLYEMIQELELPPGERLVEADLAARFGVSKTPVREALLMLERDRLVATVPHVGATVTWLSIEDYQQHLFVLDALELPALWLVAERITPTQIASCQRIVDAAQRAHAKRDKRHYPQLVGRMHTELFATVGYPQLTDFIELVHRSLRRYAKVFIYRFPDNWVRDSTIVRERFEHVRKGDPEGAAAAVRRGHAELFRFAQERVQAGDPSVTRYVLPERQGSAGEARKSRRPVKLAAASG